MDGLKEIAGRIELRRNGYIKALDEGNMTVPMRQRIYGHMIEAEWVLSELRQLTPRRHRNE